MFRFAKVLLILIFILSAQRCYSQLWVSSFSGNTTNDLISEDKAFSIAVSNSGFVYVTGFITTDYNGTDICTIKYDQAGDTVWTQTYNGTGNSEDKAYAIVIDDMDNIYITGYTTSDNAGVNIITIKYDTDGNKLWESPFNGTGNAEDKSQALCIDQNGNVYVTGYATNAGCGKDIVVIKYDTDGYELWTYTYNNPYANSDDIANAIVLDNQGRVIVTGSSMRGTEDMITIKLYPDTGTRVWYRIYNGSGQAEDKAYAIVIDDMDNVIITGYTTNEAGVMIITTIKYFSFGYIYWINNFDYTLYDSYASSIAVTPDNGIIVTGSACSGPADGTEDYITVKYSYLGEIEWVKTYDGSNTDISYSLVVSEEDNSVYITGSSKSDTTAGSEDMFTVEYDLTTGDLLDTARYDGIGGGEDVAYDIAIDTSGNVYITGYTEPVNGYDITSSRPSDYLTVKYTMGNLLSRRNSTKIPFGFALHQNYPNPFNPNTVIKFTLPQKGFAKLTVFDMLGREVDVLVNETLTGGDYSAEFNGNKLASGIYFYELRFSNYKEVRKMVLVK